MTCCAQSLVPACCKRQYGVQRVKWVFFFGIKTKGNVRSHFQRITKVKVPAERCNGKVPKVLLLGKSTTGSLRRVRS